MNLNWAKAVLSLSACPFYMEGSEEAFLLPGVKLLTETR